MYIHQLERIQRQAIRFVNNNYQTTPGTVTSLFKKQGWLTLETRRKVSRLTMMYKILNKLVDIPTVDCLTPNNHSSWGHKQKLMQIRTRARIFDNSFFPRTIKDWNSLPRKIIDGIPLSHSAFRQERLTLYGEK